MPPKACVVKFHQTDDAACGTNLHAVVVAVDTTYY